MAVRFPQPLPSGPQLHPQPDPNPRKAPLTEPVGALNGPAPDPPAPVQHPECSHPHLYPAPLPPCLDLHHQGALDQPNKVLPAVGDFDGLVDEVVGVGGGRHEDTVLTGQVQIEAELLLEVQMGQMEDLDEQLGVMVVCGLVVGSAGLSICVNPWESVVFLLLGCTEYPLLRVNSQAITDQRQHRFHFLIPLPHVLSDALPQALVQVVPGHALLNEPQLLPVTTGHEDGRTEAQHLHRHAPIGPHIAPQHGLVTDLPALAHAQHLRRIVGAAVPILGLDPQLQGIRCQVQVVGMFGVDDDGLGCEGAVELAARVHALKEDFDPVEERQAVGWIPGVVRRVDVGVQGAVARGRGDLGQQGQAGVRAGALRGRLHQGKGARVGLHDVEHEAAIALTLALPLVENEHAVRQHHPCLMQPHQGLEPAQQRLRIGRLVERDQLASVGDAGDGAAGAGDGGEQAVVLQQGVVAQQVPLHFGTIVMI